MCIENNHPRLIGVAAYTVGETERLFGGPEEGGWYWDCFTPQRVLLVPQAKSERCERLLDRWRERANASRPKLSSVLSYGVASYYEGFEPQTPRPQFE